MNDVDRSIPAVRGRAGWPGAVLDAVGTVVVGKRDALELVLAGILAGGHVLLEDLPGLGKTLTARCFAQALGLDFRRLQFTPDLLPADVTGSFLYDQRNGDFAFRAGPVFTNLLLADEINRTPPKTQSALLEAMQEKQVSVEGVTYRLDPPFHVLATANPIEYEGTYPLPEAQLDRFLLRVVVRLPGPDEEWRCCAGGWPAARRRPARAGGRRRRRCGRMQAALEDVAVEDSVGRYIVTLAAATREHPSVLVGASPRGSLALLLLARARAVDGRPRLRGARGRQGGGGARAGAPDHAAAGDVAAPGRPGVRGQRGARRGAGPGQRRAAHVRRPAASAALTSTARAPHRDRRRRRSGRRRGRRPGRSAGRCCSPACC